MANARLERSGSPTGLKRFLFRAPIALYRVGLGGMFGKRFVMLEHVGRKSGEIRRTVLEVVVNDEDAIYVAAAWGEKAQWLQNVRADPNVAFHLGSKKYRCSAEMVPKATAVTLMGRYADEHPKALDKLSSFMLDEPGETAEEQAARIGAAIPFVRLPKRVDGGA